MIIDEFELWDCQGFGALFPDRKFIYLFDELK
jgi:hypothetical protein